jgi:hypothetical protein
MPSWAAGESLRNMNQEAIHPAVRVGHVHLRVADLDRALAFCAGQPALAHPGQMTVERLRPQRVRQIGRELRRAGRPQRTGAEVR